MRVLAIRHIAFEDLGSFAPVLTKRGFDIDYVEAAEGLHDVDGSTPALLIVLGGPIGAYEDASYPFLKNELRLLERRLAAGRPTLGICLGAQLMARALGARVYPGPRKEIGWAPLTSRRKVAALRCDALPLAAGRCCIGTGTPSTSRWAQYGWPQLIFMRTKRSPGAMPGWHCNFTRRSRLKASSTGSLATPARLPIRPVCPLLISGPRPGIARRSSSATATHFSQRMARRPRSLGRLIEQIRLASRNAVLILAVCAA